MNELPSRHIGIVSLDDLWAQASALGEVSIERIGGQHVEIKFYTKSKSLVYARAYHTDIYEAFRLAIREARELKGGLM